MDGRGNIVLVKSLLIAIKVQLASLIVSFMRKVVIPRIWIDVVAVLFATYILA
jgi:hypothetical protein